MAKLTLTDLTSAYSAVTSINSNNALIEAALENTLSRDGTTPNTMSANLDMNSNRILNLPAGSAVGDPVNVQQLLDAATPFVGTGPASNITIADAGAHFVAVNVEGALQEIEDEMGSTSTGEGASKVGIEDSGALYTATEVEAALQEVRGTPTETEAFCLELATQAEVDAGLDIVRAVTPATLTAFSGLATLVKGSFTGTLTGMTGATTGTIHYTTEVIDGTYTRVTMWTVAAISGTSNSTALTMTGLPAAVTPATTGLGRAVTIVIDDSNAVPAMTLVLNDSTISFAMPDGPWQSGGSFSTTGFTTPTATKGLNVGWTFTYMID